MKYIFIMLVYFIGFQNTYAAISTNFSKAGIALKGDGYLTINDFDAIGPEIRYSLNPFLEYFLFQNTSLFSTIGINGFKYLPDDDDSITSIGFNNTGISMGIGGRYYFIPLSSIDKGLVFSAGLSYRILYLHSYEAFGEVDRPNINSIYHTLQFVDLSLYYFITSRIAPYVNFTTEYIFLGSNVSEDIISAPDDYSAEYQFTIKFGMSFYFPSSDYIIIPIK